MSQRNELPDRVRTLLNVLIGFFRGVGLPFIPLRVHLPVEEGPPPKWQPDDRVPAGPVEMLQSLPHTSPVRYTPSLPHQMGMP